MAEYPFTAADLDALRQWDTPTLCNALELVVPHRRGYGFTIRPLVASDPTLKPSAAWPAPRRSAPPRPPAGRARWTARPGSAGTSMSRIRRCPPWW